MIHVLKIGGEILDDEKLLSAFINDFIGIEGKKVIVHGGGKMATALSKKLNIETELIDGRRVTNAEMLRIAVMTYSGWISKHVTALLQAKYCNALSLCGADGNLLRATKRPVTPIDFGFVGDLDADGINVSLIQSLLNQDIVPVISAITHDGKGNLLNTNADTIAAAVAAALSKHQPTSLLLGFAKTGVLLNADDDTTLVPHLTQSVHEKMKSQGMIHSGILPKISAAFYAAKLGVAPVYIGNAIHCQNILNGNAAATLVTASI